MSEHGIQIRRNVSNLISIHLELHRFSLLDLNCVPQRGAICRISNFYSLEHHCNPDIGNTQLYRLSSRIGQTKCKSSSSLKHFHFYISMFPPQYQNIFGQNFSSEFIITSSEFIIYILIETWNPFINIKYNEQYDFQNS